MTIEEDHPSIWTALREVEFRQAYVDADGVRLPPAICTALDDVSAPPFSYPERRPEQ